MRGSIESGSLFTPEVVAVIAGGQTPPYNVFPFSGAYRDLSGLLADPGANFANNVQSAARGMMAGLVYDGDPQTLTSDVLFYGRQAEVARQLEQKQRASEILREHEAEQLEKEERLQQDCKDNLSPVVDKNMTGSGKLSMTPAASDTVAAIGKALGHLIKSEFTVSLPAASLSTLTSSLTPSSLSMAHSIVPAA